MSVALKKELLFYGSYHNDAINKLIHAVCVPLLLWTGMAMLAPLKVVTVVQLDVTVSHIATLVYIVYYLYLYPPAGLITLPLLSAMVYGAHAVWTLDCSDIWIWLLVTHVISWIAQFVGHGMFEGRRPALLESFVQAFLTAPFFVFFEYCFFFGLFQELNDETQKEIYSKLQQKKHR